MLEVLNFKAVSSLMRLTIQLIENTIKTSALQRQNISGKALKGPERRQDWNIQRVT